GIEQVGVHVDVEDVGAAADLVERDVDRGLVVTRLDQPPEAGGAGDVRPLADDDEAGVRADHERLEAAEGGEPRLAGTCLGDSPSVASRMARTCSGVVPQQPPTTLTSPSA